MPTVLREGPYRFFFYASDREEPPHVHVERDRQTAKFWLQPVRLERSGGLRPPRHAADHANRRGERDAVHGGVE